MPHYKDGTPASLGDTVKGRPYNTPREVIGTVVGITPSMDTCNLEVAFMELVPQMEVENNYAGGEALLKVRSSRTVAETMFFRLKTDSGETKAFEKLA